jgi:hypothetical protein
VPLADAGCNLADILVLEASGRLVGPPVFKTGVGARAPRRVRFPSASAWRERGELWSRRAPHHPFERSPPVQAAAGGVRSGLAHTAWKW